MEAKQFEEAYPKSIAVTHWPYVAERSGKRKVMIYGTGTEALDLAHYLSLKDIRVECFVDDESTSDRAGGAIKDKNIISSIDLVYEAPDTVFILVAHEKESYGLSREKLMDMGFTEDVDFSYHSEIPGTKEPFHYDPTLSFNRIRDEIEGFEIYGDTAHPHPLKIAVLGGSTTESTLFFVKGWVQFFAAYLRDNNIPAVIYAGGTSAYTSSQELLKLIRDVIPLAPDVVISYGGANDLYMYPNEQETERHKRPFITRFQVQFINQILEKLSNIEYSLPTQNDPDWNKGGTGTVFYGLRNDKPASRFWIDNVRMSRAICREFGILYLSFFQPFRFNGFYETSDIQEIIHSRRDPSSTAAEDGYARYGQTVKKELDLIREEIPHHDFITDLSAIFTGRQNIYYDSTHVYEAGNEIIAQAIYDASIPHMALIPRPESVSRPQEAKR